MPCVTSPDMTPGLAEAWAAAERSLARSSVVIRELHDPISQADARAVFDAVWPAEDGSTQVRPNLMRALVHAGGYCAAAYDDTTDELLGATLAFLGRAEDGTTILHSHMSAVLPQARSRHIGTAMKHHQRAWAWQYAVPVVSWTFDPLVRRNAYVNLCKLGIDVRGYHVNFYGEMNDAINAGDPSDRMVAWWPVDSLRAARAGAAGITPEPEDELVAQGVRLVATPEDIVSLRSQDRDQAFQWRIGVREQLLQAFAEDLEIDGITDRGSYVLRPASTSSAGEGTGA